MEPGTASLIVATAIALPFTTTASRRPTLLLVTSNKRSAPLGQNQMTIHGGPTCVLSMATSAMSRSVSSARSCRNTLSFPPSKGALRSPGPGFISANRSSTFALGDNLAGPSGPVEQLLQMNVKTRTMHCLCVVAVLLLGRGRKGDRFWHPSLASWSADGERADASGKELFGFAEKAVAARCTTPAGVRAEAFDEFRVVAPHPVRRIRSAAHSSPVHSLPHSRGSSNRWTIGETGKGAVERGSQGSREDREKKGLWHGDRISSVRRPDLCPLTERAYSRAATQAGL